MDPKVDNEIRREALLPEFLRGAPVLAVPLLPARPQGAEQPATTHLPPVSPGRGILVLVQVYSGVAAWILVLFPLVETLTPLDVLIPSGEFLALAVLGVLLLGPGGFSATLAGAVRNGALPPRGVAGVATLRFNMA